MSFAFTPKKLFCYISLYINHHSFSQTKIQVPLSLVLLFLERASMHQPNDMIEMVSAESTTRGDIVNLNKFFANVESSKAISNGPGQRAIRLKITRNDTIPSPIED